MDVRTLELPSGWACEQSGDGLVIRHRLSRKAQVGLVAGLLYLLVVVPSISLGDTSDPAVSLMILAIMAFPAVIALLALLMQKKQIKISGGVVYVKKPGGAYRMVGHGSDLRIRSQTVGTGVSKREDVYLAIASGGGEQRLFGGAFFTEAHLQQILDRASR